MQDRLQDRPEDVSPGVGEAAPLAASGERRARRASHEEVRRLQAGKVGLHEVANLGADEDWGPRPMDPLSQPAQ
eukprot:5482008-Alexandrium_andersonii.AAC.1